MKKRALMVGSPGSPGSSGPLLRGVEHDIQAMKAMLERRGFDVEVCLGPAATRDGILAAYDRLIEHSGDGDAAVLYYSGHGFYTVVDDEIAGAWQGIVPVDLGRGTDDDFRGITAWELAIKQAQLTHRTKNVTVILDCCHAAQLSKKAAALDAVPRALPHPLRLGFAAHLAGLRARYGAAYDAVDPTGNPHAVRLVACGQTQSAYEYPGDDGDYRGAFTEALLGVLAEVGDAELSWAAIGGAIRDRVQQRFANQRPELEGPARRRLFSIALDDDSGAATVAAAEHGFRIGAGHLVGVQRGDVYGAMPLGSAAYDRARAIAELEIEQVSPTSAEARLRAWQHGHAALPQGAIAFPLEKQAVRHAVALDAPEDARPALEAAIAASRTLRVAGPGERGALATLRLGGGELSIEDPDGPLSPPMRFPDELPLAARHLANLGVARRLRELEGEHGVYASELAIEWGALDRGQPRPMPDHGGALGLRDRIYVKLRSKAQRPLYAHVFNVGLRGKVSLLTKLAPAGVALRYCDAGFTLGLRPDGALVGFTLDWPPGLPTTSPRIDQLVAIVTTEQVDLSCLETPARLELRRAPGTKLQDLLGQLQDGEPRDVGDLAPMEGFLLKRLSFFLDPRDEAMADSSLPDGLRYVRPTG